MVFGNLWFFFDLITQCFVRESEILRLILDTANKMQWIGKDHESIKAELRIFQMLERPF